MQPTIGQLVKVIDQDIWGPVLELCGNYAIIDDQESEWTYPESRLEFRLSDLEPYSPPLATS